MLLDQKMSRGALKAVVKGEKPYEYWTRVELIEKGAEVWQIGLSRFPLAVLRKCLLYKTVSHHVGERFNKVDFYAFDDTHDRDTIITILTVEMSSFENNAAKEDVWRYGYITYTSKNSKGQIVKKKEYGKTNGIRFISDDGVDRPLLWKKTYNFTEVELKEEISEDALAELRNPIFKYNRSYCR